MKKSDSPARATHHGAWDLTGVVVSGLCIIHCLAVPLVVIIFPALGWMFLPNEDYTHVWLMALVTGSAGAAFASGYRVHGRRAPVVWMMIGISLIFIATFFAHELWGHQSERVLAIIGSMALIRAHFLNRKHCRVCEGHDH